MSKPCAWRWRIGGRARWHSPGKEHLMTSKALFDLLPNVAIGFMFGMAIFGTIDLLVTVSTHVDDWLRANRNINDEVPTLKASVTELQKRQSRMELEVQQLRRFREHTGAIGKSLPNERSADLPGS
jgi:hypothetical protein